MSSKETTVYQVDVNIARAYREWGLIQTWLKVFAPGQHQQHRMATNGYVIILEFDTLKIARKFVQEFEEYVCEV